MDLEDKNLSKIRRREELLAQRVGEALDQLKPREAGDCPDAEIIAAYAEQALGPGELAQWESHFATCGRCRKILRVLVASSDVPLAEKEVTRLGELVSTVRSPVEISSGISGRARPGRMDWRARWLAPALGVAAVLTVWFAMRPPWRATDRSASETLIAQAPKAELPPSPAQTELDRLSKPAPREEEEKAPAARTAPSREKAAELNSPVKPAAKASADAASRLDSAVPVAEEARGSLQEKKKSADAMARNEAQALSPRAATESQPQQAANGVPAAPPPQANASTNAPAPSRVQSETTANAISNSAPRDKEMPAQHQAAGAAATPEISPLGATNLRKSRTAADLKSTEPTAIQATAPFGSTVWRMGKSGRIERSADAGESWVLQTSPSQEDWLAAVAISDTVCWAAGRNGSIARTADGENWERLTPPAQAAAAEGKFQDWTGITALDSRSATITARDGRKFSTTDAGKTWQAK